MYIEFQLPHGAGGQTAGYALLVVRRAILDWAQKYDVKYTEKTVKYTHRVCFDSDDLYSFFRLTWIPHPNHPSWTDYQIVVDLNHKI